MSWTPPTPGTGRFQVLGDLALGYGTLDSPLQLLDFLIGGKHKPPGDWEDSKGHEASWTTHAPQSAEWTPEVDQGASWTPVETT